MSSKLRNFSYMGISSRPSPRYRQPGFCIAFFSMYTNVYCALNYFINSGSAKCSSWTTEVLKISFCLSLICVSEPAPLWLELFFPFTILSVCYILFSLSLNIYEHSEITKISTFFSSSERDVTNCAVFLNCLRLHLVNRKKGQVPP